MQFLIGMAPYRCDAQHPDVYDMRLLEPDIHRGLATVVVALLDAGIDLEGRDEHR